MDLLDSRDLLSTCIEPSLTLCLFARATEERPCDGDKDHQEEGEDECEELSAFLIVLVLSCHEVRCASGWGDTSKVGRIDDGVGWCRWPARAPPPFHVED